MPETTQVHVNMALTNVSVAYRNLAFIADVIAPPVGVRKQQDRYFIIDSEREAFRSEVAQILDAAQLDRLKEGDSDALENVIEGRLDRLYAAKVYLQSDAATANSDALRQVVDELADVEVERHRAADVDGETERGQVH